MKKSIFRRLFPKDPVIIAPYVGFANQEKIFCQARVLEDENIRDHHSNSWFRNLIDSYKRLESDEKPNMEVRINWGGTEDTLCVTDHEGYIRLHKAHGLEMAANRQVWIPVVFELLEKGKVIHEVESTALKPAMNSSFGVISDVDDTIMETGVTSWLKWKVIVNSLFKHSHHRTSLEGAQKFYQLLHKGNSKNESNPFFYLSNSPWNFYPYLSSFLTKNKFPEGPLLLRDIGIQYRGKLRLEEKNKFRMIHQILFSYPDMPFILIGDAGEVDLDIYLRIAREFKTQIKTIYIRNVDHKRRTLRVQQLIEENLHIDVVLIDDAATAIHHAKKNNYL